MLRATSHTRGAAADGFTMAPPDGVGKMEWINARSADRAERRANELEAEDQIRRTEEEPMEMGTMDKALLREHGVGIEGMVRSMDGLSRIVA